MRVLSFLVIFFIGLLFGCTKDTSLTDASFNQPETKLEKPDIRDLELNHSDLNFNDLKAYLTESNFNDLENDLLVPQSNESRFLHHRRRHPNRFFLARMDMETQGVRGGPAGKCFTTVPGSINPFVGGQGRVTHLGRTQVLANHCLVPGTPPLDISNGEATFTAANGDELYMVYSGVFEIADNPENRELFLHFSFDGGTGRFADARGNGLAYWLLYDPVIPEGETLPVYQIKALYLGRINY